MEDCSPVSRGKSTLMRSPTRREVLDKVSAVLNVGPISCLTIGAHPTPYPCTVHLMPFLVFSLGEATKARRRTSPAGKSGVFLPRNRSFCSCSTVRDHPMRRPVEKYMSLVSSPWRYSRSSFQIHNRIPLDKPVSAWS